MSNELTSNVEEVAAAMQKSYEADIDLLERRDKAHQARIDHYVQLLEAVPIDAIESVIARYTFAIERGQDKPLDIVNEWLDQVKPLDKAAP